MLLMLSVHLHSCGTIVHNVPYMQRERFEQQIPRVVVDADER